jgi:hypothetical protein
LGFEASATAVDNHFIGNGTLGQLPDSAHMRYLGIAPARVPASDRHRIQTQFFRDGFKAHFLNPTLKSKLIFLVLTFQAFDSPSGLNEKI